MVMPFEIATAIKHDESAYPADDDGEEEAETVEIEGEVDAEGGNPRVG